MTCCAMGAGWAAGSPPAGDFMPIFTVCFLLTVVLSTAYARLPVLVLDLYAVASIMTCAAYAADKWSAQRGNRRVPERVLHLLGLLGGWPGGLCAQRLLRHKTSKRSFQRRFLATALLNCAVPVAVLLAKVPASP